MQQEFGLIITALWILFIVWWLISGIFAKRTLNVGSTWMVRLVMVAVLLVSLSNRSVQYWFVMQTPVNPTLGAIGVVLVALGVGLCIWARVYLGRNWGMPMSVKENPELVTTGPYAYVRNPIYSGSLLAILGSFLGIGAWWWLGLLVVCGIYFIYSAFMEEKIMLREFPDTYPAYKAATWRLIPWVF